MDNSQWAQEGGTVKSMGERKLVRPEKDEALNCPRCHSTNTKFCYYNNYSLTQPRYLCKTCRRYWTQGGSLRNVPVGGGSRKKNKRSSSSLPDLNPTTQFPVPPHPNPNTSAPLSALDLLRSGIAGRGLNPCIQTPGFPFQEFKPAATLGFPVDGNGTRFGGSDLHQENGGGMLLFPFGSLSKQSEGGENNKGQGNSSTEYWNGMFGGGSW